MRSDHRGLAISTGAFLCHKRINVLGSIRPNDQEHTSSQLGPSSSLFISIQKDQPNYVPLGWITWQLIIRMGKGRRDRGSTRVWNFTWYLHNAIFTCRINHLLLLEKPPNKLLDNRMKQWAPDLYCHQFHLFMVQSWSSAFTQYVWRGQSKNHVHFSDRETEDLRKWVA